MIETVEGESSAETLQLVARNRVAREEMQPDKEPEQRQEHATGHSRGQQRAKLRKRRDSRWLASGEDLNEDADNE